MTNIHRKPLIEQSAPQFKFLVPYFNGVGQIMLQENVWTGVLFLVGIFCGSLYMGLAAIISVITSTLTARLLKFNQREINSGLYGFSAALVGVALACFFQPAVFVWIGIIVGASLAGIVQHFFIERGIPAYTFPFILVTWFILVLVHFFPTLVVFQNGVNSSNTNNYINLFSHGVGQVIFQDNIWAGTFFILGILICSPIAAVFALASIPISALLAYWLKQPLNDIYLGLLSYNGVLCAITFAGKKILYVRLAFLSVILSVLFTIQMSRMSLPVLTFPFVLATWVTLIVKRIKYPVVKK